MYTGKVSSLISQDYFWNAYMAEKFNESYCCHTLCKTTFQSKSFGVTCCITHKGENESFLCFSKGNPRTCISIDVLWNSVDVIGVLSIGVFTFVLFSTIWRLMMNNYYLLHEIFLASRKSAKCFSLGVFSVPRCPASGWSCASLIIDSWRFVGRTIWFPCRCLSVDVHFPNKDASDLVHAVSESLPFPAWF